ncbi:MAG: hypothetical protein OZSIB_0712 [Candidatus Ozemobacter sibiricus]|jgi:hypothetical protein|uniref:Uncharacterized protein n=1 Tax=Candidatus Ozemobacter sibiricus TaxID=2268124 RepID=A0A367ZTW3_9BACT|nr:MAG: hypothetical protein OZSIB_0712 [Candidatus Ozemobacter sibiricus]
MFFKQILVLFIVLGVLGFIYGDRLFYFQANIMINWQYDFPAYEAYERIVHYYPKSPYRQEALKMMEILVKRNGDLRRYLDKRDSGLKKLEKERAKQMEFR